MTRHHSTLNDDGGDLEDELPTILNEGPPLAPSHPRVGMSPTPTIGGPARSPVVGSSLKHVGPYEIQSELGRGGSAVVFRARHVQTQQLVALKLLVGGAKPGSKTRERFLREARLMATLSHPNLVSAVDVGEEAIGPYLALDLVQGESLADRLAKEGALAARDAVELLEQIADALGYAHTCGVLHRDLKPHNMLLSDDGRPLLTDFGVARSEEETRLTTTGQMVGTPAYLSPEQAAGSSQVDARSDVYSLGVTLYELTTGALPFEEETVVGLVQAIINRPPVRPRTVCPGLSPELEAIVLRCLEKEPEDRYPSAQALRQDLLAYLDGRPVAAAGGGGGSSSAPWIATATVALACFGVAVSWATRVGRDRDKAVEARAKFADVAREERARSAALDGAARHARNEAAAANATRDRIEATLAERDAASAALHADALERLGDEASADARFAEAAAYYASALEREDHLRRRYALARADERAWRGVDLGGDVIAAFWSPSAHRLAIVRQDGLLELYDPKQERLLKGGPTPFKGALGARIPLQGWSPDGRVLVCGYGTTFVVFDTLKNQRTQVVLDSPIAVIVPGATHAYVGCSGQARQIEAWNYERATRSFAVPVAEGRLAVSPAGRFLVTAESPAEGGSFVRVWDGTGKAVAGWRLSVPKVELRWVGERTLAVWSPSLGLWQLRAPQWSPEAVPLPQALVRRHLDLGAVQTGASLLARESEHGLWEFRLDAEARLQPAIHLPGSPGVQAANSGRGGVIVGLQPSGEVLTWRRGKLVNRRWPKGASPGPTEFHHVGDDLLLSRENVDVSSASWPPLVRLARTTSAGAPEQVVAPPASGARHVGTIQGSRLHVWSAPPRARRVVRRSSSFVAAEWSSRGALATAGFRKAQVFVDRQGALSSYAASLGSVLGLAWHPQGDLLAAACDQGVELWQQDGASIAKVRLRPARSAVGHSEPAWSPDGARLAVGVSRDGHDVIVFLDESGGVVGEHKIPPGWRFAPGTLRWGPASRRLVYGARQEGGDARRQLWLWELGSARMLSVQTSSTGPARGRRHAPWAWSPTGEQLAVHTGAELSVLDAKTGKVHATRPRGDGLDVPGEVTWSRDRIAWATMGKVSLLDAASLEPIAELNATHPTWSNDGELLATHSEGGARVYDRQGRLLQTLETSKSWLLWAPKSTSLAALGGNELEVLPSAPYPGDAALAPAYVRQTFGLRVLRSRVEPVPREATQAAPPKGE